MYVSLGSVALTIGGEGASKPHQSAIDIDFGLTPLIIPSTQDISISFLISSFLCL